jgi:hypothetical protein
MNYAGLPEEKHKEERKDHMNINSKMLKQVQEMQVKMQRMQEEIMQREFEADAGGGAVRVVALGEGTLVSIKINPDVLKDGDAEMLEDLILTAVNDAISKGKDEIKREMSKLTAGLGLPGMPGLGF